MRRGRRTLATLVAAAALVGVGHAAAQESPPGTSITSGPSGQTADTTPTFSFASNEANVAFECRLERVGGDAGSWRGCTSPHTVQADEGEYAFHVRAIDAAGNVDDTPASVRFTVDLSAVDTFIDAGPDGPTRDPTPSFTFGSETSGATFECRIDGSGTPLPFFAACSAPFTSPPLASGSYVLRVRALDTRGRADATPAARAFSVDADPPDTAITGGPAEGGVTGDVAPLITYASEPGATFECRIDNRQSNGTDTVEWRPCGDGGYRPLELAGGQHTFEVRASDAVGNVDPTPAQRTFQVQRCEPVVRFGVVEAESACWQNVGTQERKRWESEDDVRLNGLPLPAPGPARVVIQEPTPDEPGGTVSVSQIRLEVAGALLHQGALTWRLPKAAGDSAENDSIRAASIRLGADSKLFGLDLSGEASLDLRRRNGDEPGRRYSAVLGLHVALPSVFKSGTAPTAGGVTGDVAIRMNNRDGVLLDGLKVAVNDAYIGSLGVKTVCLSFIAAGSTFVQPCEAPRIGNGVSTPFIQCQSNNEQDRWDGAAAIILPTASRTELGVWAGLRGGRLSHAGGYVDNLGTVLPLAPGVFLDRIAIGVCLDPLKLKGGTAITLAGGGVKIDGSIEYGEAVAPAPWYVEARGGIEVFQNRMADAFLKYQGTGLIDLGFNAHLAIPPVSIDGGVTGWVETRLPSRFNLRGRTRVCVDTLACATSDAVLSTIGAAGCITVTVGMVPVPVWVGPGPFDWRIQSVPVDVTGGAGYRWATKKLDVMVASCSIGPYEQQRAKVRAAGDGPPAVTLPDGLPAATVTVRGQGAAPKVALVGPDGRRVESPDHGDGSFVRDDHLLSEDAESQTTTVMVAKPAGGTWRVEAKPGSAPLASVQHAEALPEPSIGARVAGRGHDRTLHYVHAPQAGERVTFVERGPQTQQTLGVARGGRCRERIRGATGGRTFRCGTIRFRPGLGHRGRREILALVEQDGQPRKTLTVASYTAPAPVAPARPRGLRIKRSGSRVRITWRRARASAEYNVVVRTGDGRRLLFIRPASRRAVTVPRVARASGVSVSIRGVRADRVEGPAGQARIAPGQRAHPKPRRRARRSTS